ncbi:MAG TPA: hypothetical protein VFB02_14035 [Bradyrhizobium sp.]|nr:hypothetical protein [Bradyrhizobium sp.]
MTPRIENPTAFEVEMNLAEREVMLMLQARCKAAPTTQIQMAAATGALHAAATTFMCTKHPDVPIGLMAEAFLSVARDIIAQVSEAAEAIGMQARGGRA